MLANMYAAGRCRLALQSQLDESQFPVGLWIECKQFPQHCLRAAFRHDHFDDVIKLFLSSLVSLQVWLQGLAGMQRSVEPLIH